MLAPCTPSPPPTITVFEPVLDQEGTYLHVWKASIGVLESYYPQFLDNYMLAPDTPTETASDNFGPSMANEWQIV